MRLSCTRGVDESRRSFAAMAEEAQRTGDGGCDSVLEVQQAALIALNDLDPAVGELTRALRGPLRVGLSDGIQHPVMGSACGWPRDWVG